MSNEECEHEKVILCLVGCKYEAVKIAANDTETSKFLRVNEREVKL